MKMNTKSLVGLVAVSLSMFVGCGDNSEGPIPGLDENAAGNAGGYVPPLAGTGGSTQTGGTGGSNVQTGGAAGTGGSQAGTGGSNSNPSTGGSGGGTAGTGGEAGSAGSGGSGGSSETGGAAGEDGTGGSAGTGGSTGGTGGSTGTVCTPNASAPCALSTTCMGETTCKSDGSGYNDTCDDVNNCNSGTGGSSGSGGSGGSAGTGGAAGTGGSGGSVSTLGDMSVTINIPVCSTDHDIYMFAQDKTPQSGTVDWNTTFWASNTNEGTYTFKVAPGDVVKVGGYYDPEVGKDPWAKKFCDPVTLKRVVAVWATFNGEYVPAPEVKSNGDGGCDFYFHAIALEPTADDSDGDGDPDEDDCLPLDPRGYHGQTESCGDNLNLDCIGGNDPSRVRYRLTTISGLDPVLEDWDRSGLERHMVSVGSGIYETLVESPVAPKNFTIDMGVVNGWATWDIGYNNGTCSRPTYVPVTLTVSDEESGSLYNLIPEASYDDATHQWTCHDVVTNL